MRRAALLRGPTESTFTDARVNKRARVHGGDSPPAVYDLHYQLTDQLTRSSGNSGNSVLNGSGLWASLVLVANCVDPYCLLVVFACVFTPFAAPRCARYSGCFSVKMASEKRRRASKFAAVGSQRRQRSGILGSVRMKGGSER